MALGKCGDGAGRSRSVHVGNELVLSQQRREGGRQEVGDDRWGPPASESGGRARLEVREREEGWWAAAAGCWAWAAGPAGEEGSGGGAGRPEMAQKEGGRDFLFLLFL